MSNLLLSAAEAISYIYICIHTYIIIIFKHRITFIYTVYILYLDLYRYFFGSSASLGRADISLSIATAFSEGDLNGLKMLKPSWTRLLDGSQSKSDIFLVHLVLFDLIVQMPTDTSPHIGHPPVRPKFVQPAMLFCSFVLPEKKKQQKFQIMFMLTDWKPYV